MIYATGDFSMTLNNFLQTLFDPDTSTCYTALPTGISVKKWPSEYDTFFCINSLDSVNDRNPEASYHDTKKPRRADCNVTCFRNFLIELDSMALESQIEYVTSRVPVTSITYSGGKSYHFIISLETPLQTLQEYKTLAARLHAHLPLADKSCKNPSRLSRLPFATRKDTGKEQTLVQLNSRIALQALTSVLPLVSVKNFQTQNVDKEFITAKISFAVSNPNEAMQEMQIDSRNGFMFWLGKRLKELELSEDTKYVLVDKAYNNLSSTNGFSIEEAYSAARLK